MAKRKRGKRRMIPSLIDRLPFRPPLDKEAWGKIDLSGFMENPASSEYFLQCEREITASGRASRYVDVLAMIAHIGRIEEFDPESLDKFHDEAVNQHFTVRQLNRALAVILHNSGPRELFPNAVAAFEFVAFAQSFVVMFAEHQGQAAITAELTDKMRMTAVMAFVAAVNAELGICPDPWRAAG